MIALCVNLVHITALTAEKVIKTHLLLINKVALLHTCIYSEPSDYKSLKIVCVYIYRQVRWFVGLSTLQSVF